MLANGVIVIKNTCNQTYTITTQSKGERCKKCPNKNGDTQTCSTGLCKDTTCDENGKSKTANFVVIMENPKMVYTRVMGLKKCKENACNSGYDLDDDDICQPSYFCDHGEFGKGYCYCKKILMVNLYQ